MVKKLVVLIIPLLSFSVIINCQSPYAQDAIKLFQAKEYEEAVKGFTNVINNNLENEVYYGYYYRGFSYYKLGKSKKSISDLKKALCITADDKWYSWIKSNSLMLISRILEKKGKLEKSYKTLQEAIKYKPGDSNAYSNLSLMEFDMQLYEKAYQSSLIAIESDSTNSYALSNQSIILLKLGELEKAMESVEKSIELNDQNSYAFKHRALIFIELEKYQLACEDLNMAIVLNYSEYGGKMKEIDSEEVEELLRMFCQKE